MLGTLVCGLRPGVVLICPRKQEGILEDSDAGEGRRGWETVLSPPQFEVGRGLPEGPVGRHPGILSPRPAASCCLCRSPSRDWLEALDIEALRLGKQERRGHIDGV